MDSILWKQILLMFKPYYAILVILLGYCPAWSQPSDLNEKITASLELASEQYVLLDHILPDSLFPRAIGADGKLVTNKSGWWTSGFFPASLWYLYEYKKDPLLKDLAISKTKAVEREKLNISDHDLGFKIYCPFGNAFRITGDSSYIPAIISAAQTLSKRFDPGVGLIRSWGKVEDKKEYLVIIDNMMNLELLFAATRFTGDSSFYRIALSQADKTIAHHFRADGSSYHVLDYDPYTGQVRKKRTAQGFSDESAWSRGQAWGLYGYTVCYRETGIQRYLDQANKIARFMLHHPNMPANGIPYWDFNADGIPNTYRDASAAAIMGSALIELSGYVPRKLAQEYKKMAATIIVTLSDSTYRTKLNEKYNFLLKHSVGHLPANSEVDTPLSYADYYYLEAMLRWRKMKK